MNNIPVAEYAQRSSVVFNTPGANTNAVKELVEWVTTGYIFSLRPGA